MTYKDAVILLGTQERNLRKINGTRFIHNGYEYRIKWFGGFAAYVGVDRRQIGKRNFKYFSGIGAFNLRSCEEVMKAIMEEIQKKENRC